MKEQPIFNSVEQMATVTFNMLNRLAIVVGWTIFCFAHAAALLLLLIAFWAFGVSPADVAMAFHSAHQQTPVAIASAIGFSVLGVISIYWKAAKWLNAKTLGGWLIGYLLQDAKG